LTDAASIERAIAAMHAQGWRLTVRRAYGGHEKLAGLKDCLVRHGIRAFVNQGKGTTDALLVVDVMDLLHAGRLPAVAAIVSSDADFAPLAIRLREAGAWVVCFAQQHKAAGEELAKAYDELTYLDAAAPARAAAKAARKTAAKTAAKKAAPVRPAEPDDPVRALLDGLPELAAGHAVELNEVVKALRDAKLLGRSASGPKFLAKHAPYLELSPATQPNKARLKAVAHH
jgi:hypothetical protein